MELKHEALALNGAKKAPKRAALRLAGNYLQFIIKSNHQQFYSLLILLLNLCLYLST